MGNQKILTSYCLVIIFLITLSPALPMMNSYGDNDAGIRISEEDDQYDVEVIAPPHHQEGDPGEIVRHEFTIRNNGTVDDIYALTVESGRAEWNAWIEDDQDQMEIESEENESVGVYHEIPEDPEDPNSKLWLYAESLQDDSSPPVSDEASINTVVEEVYEIIIDPLQEQKKDVPGSTVQIGYQVKNNGTVEDSYEISASTPNWKAEVVEGYEEAKGISPGETFEVFVEISLPELTLDTDLSLEEQLDQKNLAAGAKETIQLNIRSNHIGKYDHSVEIEVEPYYSASFFMVNGRRYIYPRDGVNRVYFDIEIGNVYNVKDEPEQDVALKSADEKADFETGWQAREDVQESEVKRWRGNFSSTFDKIEVEGGQTRFVEDGIEIKAPPNPLNGTFTAPFKVIPEVDGVSEEFLYNGTGEAEVVVNQVGDVDVSAIQEEMDGKPFEKVQLNFTVENTGNGIDDYILSSSTENGWNTALMDGEQTVSDLHPGDMIEVGIEVQIPDQVPVGHEEKVELMATSLFEQEHNQESVSDSAQVIIMMGEGYSVILEPDMNRTTTLPEETVSYQINVTNAGNTRDTIMLSLETPDTDAWDAELERTSLSVDRWNTSSTELHITPTSDAIHEEPFNVTVVGTSRGDDSRSDNATTVTQVEHVPDVGLDMNVTYITITPGETLDFDLSVKNEGNAFDTFNLSGEATNTNWEVEVEDALQELEPREYGYTNVSIKAPDIPHTDTSYENLEELGILGGERIEVILTATSTTDSSVYDSVERQVEVEDVRRHDFRSFEMKDVLPGHSVTHEIRVENRGNAEDTVYLTLEDGDNPYLDYVHLEDETVDLDIGDSNEVNVTLEVPTHLQPYWHQEIRFSIGNEDLSESARIRTRVVLLGCEEPLQQIRVGRSASYDLTIVNVPTEEEVETGIGEGDLLAETFDLTGAFEEGAEEGWDVSFSKETVEFTEAYDTEDITVVLDSPDVETERIQVFEITAESNQEERNIIDTVTTETQMSWFDLRPIDISIEPGPDGRELDLIFKIERSGVEELFPIPFELYVNGNEIDQGDIEFVGSELISDTEEIFTYKTTYDLKEWSWEETIKEYEVTVNVDPDDEIYMINAAGDADENNEMTEEIQISRFHRIPYWFPFLLLIVSLICFMGCWIGLKRYNGLSVGAGISLGGIFGSLVLLPWYWILSITQADYAIMSVVAVGMVSFALFLFAIRFKLKNLLSSVTEHIIQKNGWETYVEKDTQEKSKASPYLYYLTMSLTGFLSYFSFLLFTSIDLLLLEEYLSIFASDFFSIPYMIAIPNMIFLVIYLTIGFAVAFTVSRLHERLWKRILKNEQNIQQLRKKADSLVKRGERSVPE